MRAILEQGAQHLLALPQRKARQILAVQLQQVEDIVHHMRCRILRGVLQQLEIRSTFGIERHDLAIEHCLPLHPAQGTAHIGIGIEE